MRKSKYQPIGDYLKSVTGQKVRLSYKELEEVLNFKLPASAHVHRQFWENDSKGTRSLIWLTEDWEVCSVVMGDYVEFEKIKEV
jgi:hypothetical protein